MHVRRSSRRYSWKYAAVEIRRVPRRPVDDDRCLRAPARGIVRPRPRGRSSSGSRRPAGVPRRSARLPRASRSLRSASAAGTDSGRRTAARPNGRPTAPSQPRERSRCRTCVYSCVKTSRSQSRVLPMIESARGAAADDLDQVVGHRRRPAVREVGLVDEDDVDAHPRTSEPRFHLRGDLLGDGRRAASRSLPPPGENGCRSAASRSSESAGADRSVPSATAEVAETATRSAAAPAQIRPRNPLTTEVADSGSGPVSRQGPAPFHEPHAQLSDSASTRRAA